MTKEHKWHVVIPGPICTPEGKVYLDDEEVSLPLTGMDIRMRINEPVEITAIVLPLRGLDALLTFSEENPLVVNVYWPKCPHCGKFYDDLGNELRWSIYNLAFRLLGSTKLWPAASRIIWG